MSAVSDLYHITKQLSDLLSETSLDDERGNKIDKINDILAHRQEIIKTLPKEYSQEERDLGKKIVELNKSNHEKLEMIMSKIKTDLMLVNKKRQSTKKYIKPFQNTSRDGMFLDKRK